MSEEAPSTASELSIMGSPSHRFNNLSSGSANVIAFVDRNEVRITFIKSSNSDTPIVFDRYNIVTRAAFISVAGVEYLGVTSSAGIHLYEPITCDAVANATMKSLPTPTESEASALNKTRCTCLVGMSMEPKVYVGTSWGTVLALHLNPRNKKLTYETSFKESNGPITAIDASSMYVAAGDENGQITVWNAGTLQCLAQFPNNGNPCTTLCIRGNMVIGGFAGGQIYVFSIQNGVIAAEMRAHTRAITAMTLHSSGDMFATVGEDGCVNIWEFPDFNWKGQLKLIRSRYRPNHVHVGVAFMDTSSTQLAISSYDLNQIYIEKHF